MVGGAHQPRQKKGFFRMQSKITRGAVAAAGLGLAAGLVAAAPAAQAATTTIQVRPADLITPGTGTTGSNVPASSTQEFLAQGVHLKVTNAGADNLRGRFAVKVPFAQVHTVDYTWIGTDNHPAVFYTIDLDGDGTVDGELQGDHTYGNDVAFNHDAQEYPGSKLPAGTIKGLAPCDGVTSRPGALDTCTPVGGAGDQFHGTLDDWNRRIAAAGRTAMVVGGGYVAGGVVQDGVLTQITYGPNQYVFTNTAKSKVTVTADAKRAKIQKANKAKFSGHVDPVGAGAKVSLEAKVKGEWTVVKSRVLAATGNFTFGDKPAKVGVNRYRVSVAESNSTLAAKSSTIKVTVTK
jgi:hypothetical protein